MKRVMTGVLLTACAAGSVFGQSSDGEARFEAADVHASAKTQNPFPRTGPARGGRYEVKTASLADLIATAYGYAPDKVVGGPSWLELDRFDILAKVPADSTPDSQKVMLQNLLADRFKLVVKKENRPLPTYALTPGKKILMKEATGSEDMTGCKPQAASGAPQEGGVRLMMSTNSGPPQTFNLGPGMTLTYHCRNISMSSFAAGLRGMIGANLGTNTVVDETGLKGNWNFDLKYSMSLMGGPMNDTAERIPIGAAIEKQLGLKLEEKQVPTPVIIVESVNRKPTDNAPNIAEILPPAPVATSFEVASVKPSNPDTRMSSMRTQPGGRLVVDGMNLQFLISRAFNTFNSEEIVGIPPFAMSERFDIVAKLPAGYTEQTGMDAMSPLMLDLLKERFKLAYHKENREVTTYSLVASKPKMKKADPESRTSCKNANAQTGAPPGTRLFTCQNVTMAYFAERLQGLASGLNWPISDDTGLEGGWDLALAFSNRPMMVGMAMPAPPPPPGGGTVGGMAGSAPAGGGGGAMPAASEPSGGQTIFEAIEKQLGLKLEKVKKSMPVIVIDHIEQRPTEN